MYRRACAALTHGWILPVAALLAGAVNGLLGTGGGMVLALALRAVYRGEERTVMALSTACVLFFSVLSTILYALRGHLSGGTPFSILLPSLLGGTLGAFLLGRFHVPSLNLLLGAVLLLSGIRLLV